VIYSSSVLKIASNSLAGEMVKNQSKVWRKHANCSFKYTLWP